MKNTIKLDNPVQINGKSYDELTYDISEITAQAFAEADARKLSASGSKNGNAAGAAELDYGLHLYTPDSSDAQSETTPEPSTHQRETSESEG